VNLKDELNLSELSEESGVPPRTIRYYISRGLLPGPNQAGRGASYGREHVARLKEILDHQESGATLAEIGAQVRPRARLTMEPTSCWRFEVSNDVVVEVRGGLSPWRMKTIRSAIAELARKLGQEEN
jgi:DNA-binding transcriptional MerR regulator